MSSDNQNTKNTQVGKRVVKYCLIGLMIAFACFVVPNKNCLKSEDVLALSLVASASYAVLDLLAPNTCDCN